MNVRDIKQFIEDPEPSPKDARRWLDETQIGIALEQVEEYGPKSPHWPLVKGSLAELVYNSALAILKRYDRV